MAATMNRRAFIGTAGTTLAAALLAGCSGEQEQEAPTETPAKETTEAVGIDYMVLVNKQHKLPDGWDEAILVEKFTNTEGTEVECESKAYAAYLELKEDLEADGVYVDLNSAYRSIEAQQKIVDDFTEQYGEEYVKQYVAVPGYSEYHTGLALDLFLIIDGKGVYLNEDMVKYPEIWEKVHAKLADHGFILRYLPGKKIFTGYSYEPWHIRYLDDPAVAQEITEKGLTLEEHLDEVEECVKGCEVEYGESKLYTEPDMDSALDTVLNEFRNWTGCTMQRFAYAGDDACGDEELTYVNSLREESADKFTQAIVFITDFHSPSEEEAKETAWDPDADYKDYTWHMGRVSADDAWLLMTWGY